jgi:hypothetical protein
MHRCTLFAGRFGARISVVVRQIDVVVDVDHLPVAIAHAHMTVVSLLLLDDGVERGIDDQATLLETRRNDARIGRNWTVQLLRTGDVRVGVRRSGFDPTTGTVNRDERGEHSQTQCARTTHEACAYAQPW